MSVVTIFLSSTFRDFHGERDLMVGTVRAALDDRVRPLGCRTEIIDLRWGVANDEADDDEETRQRRILDVCLSEIARARPLFVGLVGDRYGWVPPAHRAERVAHEAGFAEPDIAGRSVTELEFIHGAFNPDVVAHSLFLFRELTGAIPAGWEDAEPESAAKLTALKQRIIEHPGVHVRHYAADVANGRIADLHTFESVVIDALGPVVEQRARDLTASNQWRDPEDAVEALFFSDRLAAIAGRDADVAGIVDGVVARRNVCLFGVSGAGKSTMWCAAVEELRRQEVTVTAVPIGAAPGVRTEWSVIGRAARHLGLTMPADVTATSDLLTWWRTALAGVGPVVVALDSLDSLSHTVDDAELRLLAGLPPNVTLMVSTTSASHEEVLRRMNVDIVDVGELAPESVAAATRALTSVAHRQLPPDAYGVLVQRPRSPLWLRLAINELILLSEDDFRNVDPTEDPIAALDRLVTDAVRAIPDDVDGIVSDIAHRADERFSRAAVTRVIQLLIGSRSGLAPLDLQRLTGLGDVVIVNIRRAFAGIIETRGAGGRWGFAHSILRDAVARLYAPGGTSAVQPDLVRYLASVVDDDPVRREDLLWHAFFAGTSPSAGDILNQYGASDDSDRAEPIVADAVLAGADLDNALTGIDLAGFDILLATEVRFEHELPVQDRQRLTAAMLKSIRMLKADPSTRTEAERTLSFALNRAGNAASDAGRYSETVDLQAEALQVTIQLLGEDLALQLIQSDDLGRLRRRSVLKRLRADPRLTRDGRNLVIALQRLGLAYRQASNGPDAVTTYDGAISVARILVEARPDWAVAANVLASSLKVRSSLAADVDDMAAARTFSEESVQHMRAVCAMRPDDDGPISELSIALGQVADVAEPAVARAAASEALTLARKAFAIDPTRNDYADRVSLALFAVTALMNDESDKEQCMAYLREAVAIQHERLAADQANTAIIRRLAPMLRRLGALLLEEGDYADAYGFFAEAADATRTVLRANPESASLAEDLLRINRLTAKALLRLGNTAALGPIFDESTAICAGPMSAATGWDSMINTAVDGLKWVHAGSSRFGDHERAHSAAEAEVSLKRRLLRGNPANPNLRRNVALALDRTAESLLALGRHDATRAALDEAFGIYRELLNDDPRSTRAQRDLAVSYTMLAKLSENEHQWEAAETLLMRAVDLFERLSAQSPDDTALSTATMSTYAVLGRVAVGANQLTSAQTGYASALVLARRALAADPTDRDAQRSVCRYLHRLGGVEADLGLHDGAAQCFGEGYEFALRCFRLTDAEPQAVTDLTVAGWDVADLARRQNDPEREATMLIEVSDVLIDAASALPRHATTGTRERLIDVASRLDGPLQHLGDACCVRAQRLHDQESQTP